MKSYLLTDVELRARWSINRGNVYTVPEGTILTPSARDYLNENGIELCYTAASQKTAEENTKVCRGSTMTVDPIPEKDGKRNFIVAATGSSLREKPEDMTHLRGNCLVLKSDSRIAYRGKIDSLIALTTMVQLTALEECTAVVADLEEIVKLLHSMMAAEVKDEPLKEISLLGMTSAELRHNSQCIKEYLGIDHPVPNASMGKLCVHLNYLRTQVRETELSAVTAFQDGGRCGRNDLVEALNRLSSAVYIIMCRKLAGYYNTKG